MRIPSVVLLSAVLSAPAAALDVSLAASPGSFRSVLGGTRLPLLVESWRAPSQAYVLSGAELKKGGAKTLADALRRVPGVVLFDQTGNEHQPTLDLRGFNATPVPATIVFVDGVRVNEADFGQVNWQLIPLAAIERVEVLSGPQTLYGKDALGGVVNVLTTAGGKAPAAEAGLDFGSFGLQRYLGSASGPLGPVRYRVNASRETSDGYRSAATSRIHLFDGRLDWKDERTEASLGYRYGDDALKQAGSLTAGEIARDRRQHVSFVETDSLAHLLTFNARRRLTARTAVSVNASLRERLENTPLNKGRTSLSRSRSEIGSRGAVIQLDDERALFGRRNIFTAGGELARSAAVGTSAGVFFGPFNSGSSDIQRQLGLFAQNALDLVHDRLTLTGGVRYERDTLQHQDLVTPANNGARRYERVSPRVALSASIVPGFLESRVSLAESFRAPTANEVSALGPFSSAPGLRPVTARTAEAGLRLRADPWGEASASVYRAVVHDEIYAVFDPSAGFGQNINIDKTRRDGLELSLRPRIGDAAELTVDYGYTEATFQTQFTLDKAPFPATQQVRVGSFLPQVPRHRVSVGAVAHPVRRLSVGVDELCVSAQHVFGDESNAEARLGGYCLLGGGASWDGETWSLYIRGDNLLDRRYEGRGILGTNGGRLERFLMPAPGISIAVGGRWRWEGASKAQSRW